MFILRMVAVREWSIFDLCQLNVDYFHMITPGELFLKELRSL